MNKFDFYQPTRLHFGAGRLEELGQIVAQHGKRCLLVTTAKDEPALSPLYARVLDVLRRAELEVVHFDGVVPNPTIGSIQHAIALVGKHAIDVVLAVGGGSSIDTAKSVALFHGAQAIDWQRVFGEYTSPFARYPLPGGEPLPVVAVPTTAGTGSETTQAMVISDPDRNEKMCIFHDRAFPREALIDPELMLSLPPRLTAMTGFDAFSHAFESFVNDIASPYTRLIGLQAMRDIAAALPALVKDPANLSLRETMARAAVYAGISLANAAATAPHPLSEIVGGVRPDIAHGQCLATLYPRFLRFVAPKTVGPCAQVARVFDPSLASATDAQAAARLPALVDAFIAEIGLDKSFAQLGVTPDELSEMEGNFLFNVLPFAPKEVMVALLHDSY